MANIMDWKIATTILCSCNCLSFEAELLCLNRLRVKIAKQKVVSLAKLSPCEASFVQDVLRASLQTYIWMKSDTAQPPEKSALDFGWEDQNRLSPVYFVGQTSSDFLKEREIIEVLEFF
jgi:hypothetical protein